MHDEEFKKWLEDNNWTIECESPLEIRHDEGSFASLYAAKILLSELYSQYKEQTEHTENSFEQLPTERYPHQHAFEQLQRLFNAVDQYVQTAWSQEHTDKDRRDETDEEMSTDAYALWETTYSLVFNKNMSGKIKDCFNELNVDLDYYDPDTTYKEDVLAYYNAVKEQIETLTELIQPK